MGVVYPIAKKQQNQGIFFPERPRTGRNISQDMSDFIPEWISKRAKTLTEKIEIPINISALCTTRPVYLIGLSHFLQRLKYLSSNSINSSTYRDGQKVRHTLLG